MICRFRIITLIREHISKKLRNQVEEIAPDLSPTMNAIAKSCFRKANRVADRFHVQKLVCEAVQQVRIVYRWEAIDQDNLEISFAGENNTEYALEILSNGDSIKQLLARSRHLLFKSPEKWTASQKERAMLIFQRYPEIKKAYYLSQD